MSTFRSSPVLRVFFRAVVFYSEKKIYNMGNPYCGKYCTGYIQFFTKHYKKPESHKKSDNSHDFDFGTSSHSLFFYIRLEIRLIKLSSCKPVVKPFRAFSKADNRKQQKRNGRQDRNYSTCGTKSKSDTSECYPKNFLYFHLLIQPPFTFLLLQSAFSMDFT